MLHPDGFDLSFHHTGFIADNQVFITDCQRRGLSQQFDDWRLSNSEKEVGWLLLKGFSLKEIAALRETLEKTVPFLLH